MTTYYFLNVSTDFNMPKHIVVYTLPECNIRSVSVVALPVTLKCVYVCELCYPVQSPVGTEAYRSRLSSVKMLWQQYQHVMNNQGRNHHFPV